jgi:type I restriction enzyme S subunit
MDPWKHCLLGDVVNLKRGYDLPHSARSPGPFPVVSSSGITDHHSEAKVKGPGVVTGRYGTLGQVFFVETDYWPLNTSLYVENFRGNDPRFVSYFLGTLNFGSQNAAGAVPGVNRNHLHAIEVRVPPLPIQRRIAGILSAYDELIENSKRRIKILEAMARALYREWFVHFRFPGHESVPRVPSTLGEIPQGWEVKKLGEIAEEMRRNVAKGQLDEPQPYVGLEHIPRRSLALDAWETTTDLGSNKLEFKKGEVLFGKIRPYFHKVSVAPFDGLCSADTIVVRARRPEYYAFVVACVSSDEFVAQATATSNGSKMPRANWGVLEERGVVIPKGKLASQFSTSVSGIIEQQQALVFQIQNLRRTRDLLLPRLLSGQIDVEAMPS